MMEKRRGRRSYLEDFQKDVNGEYQYRGTMYRYEGRLPYGKLRLRLWLCCGFGAALVLAVNCLPGITANAPAYVTLPSMLGVLAACVAVWTLGRWSYHGQPLREYVYEQTVTRLKVMMIGTAVCCAAAAVGQIIAVAQNGRNASKLAGLAFWLAAAALEGCGSVHVKRTDYSPNLPENP